jgi:hypothetical protein
MPSKALRRGMLLASAILLASGGLMSGARPSARPQHTFGMSLMTGMNNELFTLFVVKELNGQVLEARPLTRGQFVLQAQGAAPSLANPDGQNLFRKYRVTGCLPPAETDDGKRMVSDCSVFDELWKLRFWEFPFKQREGQHPGLGWAEARTQPSERQQLLLCGYGICHLTQIACGEDLFRLLRDVGDPEWVDNYRKGY